MLRTSRERSPVLVLCCLLLGLAACTFPAVDYDESSTEATGAPCAATPKCAGEVDTCWKQADGQRNSCMSQCQTGPAGMGLNNDCSTCETTHDTAMNVCVAQCESCNAADGCTNATDSCRALLGLP